MKTIEEAAREHSINAGYRPKIAADVIGQTVYESGFRAGAEFAQKWIQVEEDLPKENLFVIAKTFNDEYEVAYQEKGYWFLSDHSRFYDVTHWKYIEIT